MKVSFVSRADAMAMILNGQLEGKSLISISDTNKEKSYMSDLWSYNVDKGHAIFLNFPDVEDGSGLTNQKLEQIIRFSDKSVRANSDIVVHCFAGISRSGAVAKWINEYFLLGNQYLDDYVGHNKHIFYSLMEHSGVQTMRQFYKEQEDV